METSQKMLYLLLYVLGHSVVANLINILLLSFLCHGDVLPIGFELDCLHNPEFLFLILKFEIKSRDTIFNDPFQILVKLRVKVLKVVEG